MICFDTPLNSLKVIYDDYYKEQCDIDKVDEVLSDLAIENKEGERVVLIPDDYEMIKVYD